MAVPTRPAAARPAAQPACTWATQRVALATCTWDGGFGYPPAEYPGPGGLLF